VTAPDPVLALRALGLGDALTAVPALRGLRRAFPDRPLLLAAAGPPAELLRTAGVVVGVVPTSGLDAAPPGAGLGRHLAVNLHGCGPQSHRLLLAGDPAALLAFERPDLGIPGPAWDEVEHEVLRWCRLVRTLGPHAWCGPDDLRLPSPRRPAGTRNGPVVVHPGATGTARRWPAERFAAVARALRRYRPVVTGSPQEAELCHRVADLAGLAPGADLGGRLDLPDLAALLASARLLVCGDTGVAHLATALGTPSVLLFGPVPPSRWRPLVDVDRHRVVWHRSVLAGIGVEEVLAHSLTVLAELTVPAEREPPSIAGPVDE
jgi:Glycosyltransferase family 9 (heptosyltransferase)